MVYTPPTRKATISGRDVLQELDRRLVGDLSFDGGKILGSMCSSPHPVASLAFSRALECNIGDEGLVPGLAELERESCTLLGSWWGNSEVAGRIVTGGTEANILALWTAKIRADSEKVEVLLPSTAHYSFDKAASLMGLSLVRIPADASGRVRLDLLEAAVGTHTLAVIGIAGTTDWGAVDDVEALAAIALRHGLYFHLDASFGGFVLPFLSQAGYPGGASWPEGLSSLTADPHKMGRGPIPSGMILWKDSILARTTATDVHYLSGGRLKQNTVVGTRSGAAVAAVWAVMNHLGTEGYTDIVREAMELTSFLILALAEIPGVDCVLPRPAMNVVGVRAKHMPTPLLVTKLREKGWALSSWEHSFRIVLMPHVSRASLQLFLTDLQEATG